MWEIIDKCQRVATIEALLITTGMAIPNDPTYVGQPIPLLHKQQDFKSTVYLRKYKITTDKRLRWFCKWIDVTFKYDLIKDEAYIQFQQNGRDKLKTLIEDGFKLLEQTKPEEAERLRKLKPFNVIVPLEATFIKREEKKQ